MHTIFRQRPISGAVFCLALSAWMLLLPVSLRAAEEGADAVAVLVNGTAIRASEVEGEINRLIPQTSFHRSVSGEKRQAFREKAVENLINAELMHQDARTRGLKPDSKKVKAQLKQTKDRFRTKKEYQAALQQGGLTEEQLRQRLERADLVQAAYDASVKDPSRASDETLKEYFESNRDKFVQPESVRLRIISANDRQKAEELLARLGTGQDFGELAREESEDDFRVKGGDLGFVHRGRLEPELEKAAFALEPGKISGLIKGADRWFIAKVEEKTPERKLSFDEARENLRKDLERKREQELRDAWITSLRAKAEIRHMAPAADSPEQ